MSQDDLNDPVQSRRFYQRRGRAIPRTDLADDACRRCATSIRPLAPSPASPRPSSGPAAAAAASSGERCAARLCLPPALLVLSRPQVERARSPGAPASVPILASRSLTRTRAPRLPGRRRRHVHDPLRDGVNACVSSRLVSRSRDQPRQR